MINVKSDEIARLYATAGCIYNPRKMLIMEDDWIRACRRHTHRPKLFQYRHLRSGNFVLAHWVAEPGKGEGPGLMMELEVWKWPSERPTLQYVRARCQPMNDLLADYNAELAHQAYEEMAAEDETEVQRKDIIRWLDRKGARFEELADAMRSGEMEFVGDREGGKQLEAMKEVFS